MDISLEKQTIRRVDRKSYWKRLAEKIGKETDKQFNK